MSTKSNASIRWRKRGKGLFGTSNTKGWDKKVRGARQSTTDHATVFGAFSGGLFVAWRQGGLLSLVLPELVAWLCTYYAIFGWLSWQRMHYETNGQPLGLELFCNYSLQYLSYIPLSFILPYYLGVVYARWWQQYNACPWSGKISLLVRDLDCRDTPDGVRNRITFLRWLLLAFALTAQYCSRTFRMRHPGLKSLEKAGLATAAEIAILERSEYQCDLPIVWASELLRRQERDHQDQVSRDLRSLKFLLIDWRTACATLRGYEYATVPIALTQCMAFVVYSYFTAQLFAAQFISVGEESQEDYPQTYVPIYTLLQFIFYVGLYKVTAMMYNPFDVQGAQFDLHEYIFVWCTLACQQAAELTTNRMMPPVDESCPMTFPLPVKDENADDWAYGYNMEMFRPAGRTTADAYSSSVQTSVSASSLAPTRRRQIDASRPLNEPLLAETGM